MPTHRNASSSQPVLVEEQAWLDAAFGAFGQDSLPGAYGAHCGVIKHHPLVQLRVCVCVCAHCGVIKHHPLIQLRVCVCVCVCVCACARACVRAHALTMVSFLHHPSPAGCVRFPPLCTHLIHLGRIAHAQMYDLAHAEQCSTALHGPHCSKAEHYYAYCLTNIF